MTRRTIAMVLLSLWTAIAGTVPGQKDDEAGPATPDSLPSLLKGHEIPTWVGLSAATNGSGRLRPDRFESHDFDALEAMAARNHQQRLARSHGGTRPEGPPVPGVDCVELFGGPVMDRIHPKPNRTLADLVANATAIYRGRVQEVVPGFAEGIPQSLLRIKVDETLRQAPGERRESHVFLIYPWAHFWIGDQPFCTGVVGTHAPIEGDQVLFFRYDSSIADVFPVFVPELLELAFEGEGTGLVLPRTLAQDDEVGPVTNLGELVALVRTAMGTQP